jgi:hypothetical protein
MELGEEGDEERMFDPDGSVKYESIAQRRQIPLLRDRRL